MGFQDYQSQHQQSSQQSTHFSNYKFDDALLSMHDIQETSISPSMFIDWGQDFDSIATTRGLDLLHDESRALPNAEPPQTTEMLQSGPKSSSSVI